MNLIPILPRLGTALLLGSLALLLWPTLIIFLLFASAGFLVALTALYAAVDDHKAIRICWLIAAALLLAYDGGSVSTYLSAASAQDFAVMTKDRPIELICSTLALVNIICGLLLATGRLESPVITAITETTEGDLVWPAISAIGLLLIGVAYAAGDLGFQGIQPDQSGRVSALGAAANLTVGPLAGIAAYMLAKNRRFVPQVFNSTVLLLTLLAVVPTGRRSIVLILIIATFGFAFGGGLRRLSLPQRLLGALIGGGLAYVMSSYFFALRLAGWELGNTASLSDQLSLGLEFMFSSSLQERFTTLFYDNVRERTFVLGYLADLMEAVSKSGPLYGEALLYYIRVCIPSVFDPDKDQIIALQMIEALAHPKLGLPIIDQANTIITDGLTDFGLLGASIYTMAIVGVLRASIWLMQKIPGPITVLFGTFAILYLALKPELTLDEYLVPLRNLAIFIPVMWISEALMSSLSQPAQASAREQADHLH